VLDEADRMLDMGFIRDIKRILALLPEARQNLLFSATFSDEIRRSPTRCLHDPVDHRGRAAQRDRRPLVDQRVYRVRKEAKRHLLVAPDQGQRLAPGAGVHAHQARRQPPRRAARARAASALAIHGNKSQTARTRALADFKDGSAQVLVATDIAARGLDIKELPHVVNYDLPNVPEDYVHRIGRTGRAEHVGRGDLADRRGRHAVARRHRAPDQAQAAARDEDMAALEAIVKSAGPDIDTRPPLPPRGGRPGGGRPGGGRPGGGRRDDGRPGGGRPGGGRPDSRPGTSSAPRGEVDGNRIDYTPQRPAGSLHQPRGSGQPDGRMGRSDNRQGRDNNRPTGVGMGRPGAGFGRGSR
jgi:ATP-dependent RNA helicase RhlE